MQPGADTFKLLIGSRFDVQEAMPFQIVVIACNRDGYGCLSEFITRLRRAEPGKGHATLVRNGLDPHALRDCVLLMLPDRHHMRAAQADIERQAKKEPKAETTQQADAIWAELIAHARWMQTHFAGRCWLALEQHHSLDDAWWLHGLRELSHASGLPLVASGGVHMHVRSRKPLHDVLSAIRLGRPVSACGHELARHAEHHLRSRLRLAQRYPSELLANTLDVAKRCSFSLDELRYEYPEEVVPRGQTPTSHLRQLTERGLLERFPQGLPPAVRAQIERELCLINELGYEKYFLTVHDIVRFARSRNILCQGRGSAANSAVC
jgi:error-prone DNA polymerase